MECSISVSVLALQSKNTSFSAPNANVSQSPALANQFKPAILQCFGDIAGAIGGHFETYLSVVAQVLQQAAGVQASKCFGLFRLRCLMQHETIEAYNTSSIWLRTITNVQLRPRRIV